MNRLLVLFALFAACVDRPLTNVASTSGDGDSIDCSKLDESGCSKASGCKSMPSCPNCSGDTPFVGCEDRATKDPIVHCAPPSCPRCEDLDELACGDSNCVGVMCEGCNGSVFHCYGSGSVPECPPPPPCAHPECGDFGDAVSCNQSGFCHAVFTSADYTFDHCALYATAICSSNVSCSVTTPVCEGDYTQSIVDGCYEGCVLEWTCNLPD